MKSMKATGYLILTTILVGATGCASAQPPKELVDARAAYNRASNGTAAQLAPADLHSAKRTLDAAEKSFNDDGDGAGTKDLAYTAQRRIELAESRARVMAASAQQKQIEDQSQRNQATQLASANAELGRTRDQLEKSQQQLKDAERRAAQAAADLAKLGSVKQETRGIVLTLSGGVLFTTGKAALLPAAQVKLNEVADVLAKQDTESKIVVEGHTDSQGGEAMNQELSQKRAESVRTYLVSRGIAADRITASGFGPSRPIADNTSPEGRANNRRVEIVVQNGQGGGGQFPNQ